MARHRIAAPLLAAALTLLAACGDGGTGATPVYTVVLEADDVELEVGATQQLAAQAFDSRGNQVFRTPRWSVTDTSVATISESGLLTARKTGIFQATAQVDGERDTRTFRVVRSFLSCPLATLGAGESAFGALESTDCEVDVEGQKKYVEVFRMTLAQGHGLQLALVGPAGSPLKPYLYLYDRRGVLVAASDVGRITLTVSAGQYYVVASSASPSASAPANHGAFSLFTR